MLLLAGFLFVIALMLAFVDWWVEDAAIDLTLPVRLLFFCSAVLVGMNAYFLSQ
jgi:hypothetical protein